jgi:hypothetical protein
VFRLGRLIGGIRWSSTLRNPSVVIGASAMSAAARFRKSSWSAIRLVGKTRSSGLRAAICRPRDHQAPAPFEQVATTVGLLDLAADSMRQRHFGN